MPPGCLQGDLSPALPNLGARNPEPENRNPEPETRNPKLETRNPESVTQNPKPETRYPEPGVRNPKGPVTLCGRNQFLPVVEIKVRENGNPEDWCACRRRYPPNCNPPRTHFCHRLIDSHESSPLDSAVQLALDHSIELLHSFRSCRWRSLEREKERKRERPGIQISVAQGRSTKLISMIKWVVNKDISLCACRRRCGGRWSTWGSSPTTSSTRSPLIPKYNRGSTFALRRPHSRLLSRWGSSPVRGEIICIELMTSDRKSVQRGLEMKELRDPGVST